MIQKSLQKQDRHRDSYREPKTDRNVKHLCGYEKLWVINV